MFLSLPRSEEFLSFSLDTKQALLESPQVHHPLPRFHFVEVESRSHGFSLEQVGNYFGLGVFSKKIPRDSTISAEIYEQDRGDKYTL
jgi:hypothetical protein